MPYWNFIDWAYMPRYEEIIDLGGNKELTVHSLFYSYTLKKAVELFEWSGKNYHEEHYGIGLVEDHFPEQFDDMIKYYDEGG